MSSEIDPHGGVLVSVRDTGIGFDKAEAGRLFDAFYTTRPRAEWGWGSPSAARSSTRIAGGSGPCRTGREARSSAPRCPPPRAREGRLARCVRPLIAPRQLSRI